MEGTTVRDICKRSGVVVLMVMVAFVALLPSTARAEFQVNGNVVTDTRTGLMWVQSDDNSTISWQEALAYCDALSPPDSLAGMTTGACRTSSSCRA